MNDAVALLIECAFALAVLGAIGAVVDKFCPVSSAPLSPGDPLTTLQRVRDERIRDFIGPVSETASFVQNEHRISSCVRTQGQFHSVKGQE